jgi:serine/threonine-protein kinase
MDKVKLRKAGYITAILLCTVLLAAFVTGQIIMPLFVGSNEEVDVPDVLGKNIIIARETLRDAGLHTVIQDSIWSDGTPIETVLDQYPKPGETIKTEGTVYLVICKGSQTVSIPAIGGRLFEDAFIALRENGLRAVVADSLFNDSYPVNTVIRTSPPSGAKVDKSTLVKMYLSRGPEPVLDAQADSMDTTAPNSY